MLKLTLPMPDSKLSANQVYGNHWSKSYKLKKQVYTDGYNLAYKHWQNNKQTCDFTGITNLSLEIKAYFKYERHLDDDNLLFAFKSVRDGVFLFLNQKFKLNDKMITLTVLDTGFRDKLNPRIEIILKARA